MTKVTFADLRYYFVVFVTLVSIRLWSFQLIPDRIYDIIEIGVIVALFAIAVNHLSKIDRSSLNFKTNVNLFIALPFVSAIGAMIFHDQAAYLSVWILRTNLYWLFYYVLHIYRIPRQKIIKLVVFVGIIWAIITIVQQFTYPLYFFYERNEDDGKTIIREGVYRFLINRHQYGMFACFYSFYQVLTRKRKLIPLVTVLLMLVGFFYFGTRQIAIALIIGLIIGAVSQKNNVRLYAIAIIIILFCIAFSYSDLLFSGYIEMTRDQLGTEDDVRLLSAHFYLFEYWPHWLAYLIGNGMQHSYSKYGAEIEHIQSDYGYHRVDIGIIGTLNVFGIIYVINVFWFNFKGMARSIYTSYNKYIRLTFYTALMLIFISEFYSNASSIPFFCFMIYLIDIDLKSEKALQVAKS